MQLQGKCRSLLSRRSSNSALPSTGLAAATALPWSCVQEPLPRVPRGPSHSKGLPRCSPAPACGPLDGVSARSMGACGKRGRFCIPQSIPTPSVSPSRCSTFSSHLRSGTRAARWSRVLQEALAGGRKRESRRLRPSLPAPSGLVAARSWATRPGQDIASCPALSLGGETMQTSASRGPPRPVRSSLSPAELDWD